jgi:RNA polymerase sigma factor (sigma-70 family)
LTKTKLEIEEVYKILSWLKDFDQDIFLLRFVEWFTPKEIAEKFDMSVNVITVQLHRLKQKIKSKSKFKFI